MLESLMTHNAVLYLRGHFANSLTSAVELAQKTRSTKHIAFAERLLKIKNAAPATHLSGTTFYKGHMNYRAHSDQKIVRGEKYLGLKQQLDKVKETKRFLAGEPPYEMNSACKAKLCLESVRRDLNYHLAAAYPASSGVDAVNIMINALFEQTKGENSILNQKEFSRLAKTIHAMINEKKRINDIAALTMEYVLRGRQSTHTASRSHRSLQHSVSLHNPGVRSSQRSTATT